MNHRMRLAMPVNEQDHIQGPSTAAVTLVQYGDYECPYTRQATTVVKALQQELGERLRFVYRNFPLAEIHPHAYHSAEAAESAAAQGKFWEMHDYIFQYQHTLEDSNLEQFAAAVGLEMLQFKQDMSQHRYIQRIEQDIISGEHSGVEGTPAFFINGLNYTGSWEKEELKQALESA